MSLRLLPPSPRPCSRDGGSGGLELLNEDGRDGTLIANAIITVSIDDGK
jgi:hypothetical protein